MAAVETYPERYANSQGFAREVNLPLLGTARLKPVPVGAGLAQLLEASSSSGALAPVVDGLTETRRSLTLRSLLVAGFAHDPECFAVGLSIAREWSRRGLRVAVVDLDFWNPSISRPPSHPNEGLVDVLEYGCSFGRVAWEVVADKLWMIGPGSHPPDETRLPEHSDWPRAARVLASRVDVALYVAPLLDRRGFTGKLSKKMDAVILTASVERIDRTNLRDAFLELWGSDAPMIGCVGIEPIEMKPAPVAVGAHSGPGAGAAAKASAAAPAPPAPAHGTPPPARGGSAPSAPPAAPRGASAPAAPTHTPPAAPTRTQPPTPPRAASSAPAPPSRTSSPAPAPPTPSRAPVTPPSRSAAPPASRPAPPASRPAPSPTGSRPAIPAVGPAPGPPPSVLKSGPFEDDWTEPAVVAALERDVIGGIVEPEPKKSRAWIWVVLVSLILGAVIAAMLVTRNAPPRGSVQAQQPAGEEPITPATVASGDDEAAGSAVPGSPPSDSPAPGTASPSTAPPASNPGAASHPGSAFDDALPFSVHVASFRTESKVDEVVQVLRRRNLDAWFEPPPKGGSWYRIFVGHFATEKEARDYAAWLLKNGFVESAQTYPQTER